MLLILAAVIVFAVCIRRRNKKTFADFSVGNADFKPPLPISNIIRDKIRHPIICNTEPKKNKNAIVLQLTEIPSGIILCTKPKKYITIGRKSGCTIRIKDNAAAPVHCCISSCGGQVYIEDNNTLNGTILNGILIQDRLPLFTNDLILIGNKEYKVEVLIS